MIASHVLENELYMIVLNLEEQYSIWPAEKQIPAGWSPLGKRATKSECLAQIKKIWTDMKPLALRKQMGLVSEKPKNHGYGC